MNVSSWLESFLKEVFRSSPGEFLLVVLCFGSMHDRTNSLQSRQKNVSLFSSNFSKMVKDTTMKLSP